MGAGGVFDGREGILGGGRKNILIAKIGTDVGCWVGSHDMS